MADRQELNRNLAQMLKGGVIMDVTTPEQAKIAEAAGACAVMALERIPADIRAAGGVARMSDPAMIKGIQNAVSIPVMAKCRIGHIAEARILEAIEIDYIDESEVLSPADDVRHIDKTKFAVPFVCGARDLGEALRRIGEGATMIRTKGEPGTGDVVQAVRHMRKMQSEIRRVVSLREDELYEAAKELAAPLDRRADDGAWRGRRVRGLRHLQVGRPREARGGDRSGGHQLAGLEASREALGEPRACDGRHKRRRDRDDNGRTR